MRYHCSLALIFLYFIGLSSRALVASTLIVINELQCISNPPEFNWIEFYNPNPVATNLDGWSLVQEYQNVNNINVQSKYIFKGISIPAFDYLVLPESNLGITFYPEGATLKLMDNLNQHSDTVTFYGCLIEMTYGNYETSDQKNHFPLLTQKSMDAKNYPPYVPPVGFAEINHSPSPFAIPGSISHRFVVLQNFQNKPAYLFYMGDSLYPPSPQQGYKIKGQIKYTIPPDTVLGPYRKLVITDINPAVFRTTYSIPSYIQIVGPWTGNFNFSTTPPQTRFGLYRPDSPTPLGNFPYSLEETLTLLPQFPWPIAAYQSGLSMIRVNVTTFGNEPKNWIAAKTQVRAPEPNDGWVQPVQVINPKTPKPPKPVATAHNTLSQFGPDVLSSLLQFSVDVYNILIITLGVVTTVGLVASVLYLIKMTKPKTQVISNDD